MWLHIIEGILFAHRVSRHSLTKYSFMMLYNREPVLPIDVKRNLDREKKKWNWKWKPRTIWSIIFRCSFKSATKVRTSIKDDAAENIKAVQKKQKRDYHCRHMFDDDMVILMKNNKRIDRKGGKFSQKWLGPYTVTKISAKASCDFENHIKLDSQQEIQRC